VRPSRPPSRAPALLAALLAVGGCSSDPTITVTVTAAELQRELSRKLPLTRTGRLVTVTVSSADVALAEGSDRIGLRAAATVQAPLVRPLSGTVQLDGKLRYAPEQGELWLDDVRVLDLGVAAIPVSLKPTVEELVGGLARSVLARTPVYRLKQESFKQSLAKLVLRDLRVRDGQVVATLGRPLAGGSAPR
jgi:hypothetical protein